MLLTVRGLGPVITNDDDMSQVFVITLGKSNIWKDFVSLKFAF